MLRRLTNLGFPVALAIAACATPPTGPVDEVRHANATWVLGPNISHSRGVEGGIVLLWPRIVPSVEADAHRALAQTLQDRLRAMLVALYPGRPIDVRPEPERVCPQNGCAASSVGVLLAVRGNGCYAVALLSQPERAPQRLVPWAGSVDGPAEVEFREKPESHIRTRDFAPCDAIESLSRDRDEDIKSALALLR